MMVILILWWGHEAVACHGPLSPQPRQDFKLDLASSQLTTKTDSYTLYPWVSVIRQSINKVNKGEKKELLVKYFLPFRGKGKYCYHQALRLAAGFGYWVWEWPQRNSGVTHAPFFWEIRHCLPALPNGWGQPPSSKQHSTTVCWKGPASFGGACCKLGSTSALLGTIDMNLKEQHAHTI